MERKIFASLAEASDWCKSNRRDVDDVEHIGLVYVLELPTIEGKSKRVPERKADRKDVRPHTTSVENLPGDGPNTFEHEVIE